jgi:hypothetical protein
MKVMVVMAMLRKRRIRFSRLLAHHVADNVAGGVKESGKSSASYSYGAVDLILSTCVASLVLGFSDRFKSSMAATSALGQ